MNMPYNSSVDFHTVVVDKSECIEHVEIVPDTFVAVRKVDTLPEEVVPEVIANTCPDALKQIIVLDELIPIAPISRIVKADAENISSLSI